MSKTIKLTRHIKAEPEEVYLALTKAFSIELWTAQPAVMEEIPGSAFSLLDGEISGTNLEFEYGKLIRQQWDFGDEASEVTIRLSAEKNRCLVQIEHSNIPDEAYENMLDGWKFSYLEPLRDFFEK